LSPESFIAALQFEDFCSQLLEFVTEGLAGFEGFEAGVNDGFE
jgi:hypothetical protein